MAVPSFRVFNLCAKIFTDKGFSGFNLHYTEFYAFENFKIVEQFAGIQMTGIDAILRQICDANSLGVKCYEEKS